MDRRVAELLSRVRQPHARPQELGAILAQLHHTGMAAAATRTGVPAAPLMVDAWSRARPGPGRAVPGPVGEVLLFRPPHQVPESEHASVLAAGSPAVVLGVVVPVPGLHPRRAWAVMGGEDAPGNTE